VNQHQELFFPLRKFFYRHLVYPRCPGILPDPLPCHLQSSQFKDLHQHFPFFHLAFSVIFIDTEDYRTARASLPGPDNLFDPDAFALGYRLTIRLSLLDFWSFPVTVLYRLLCAITATPLVHDFPYPDDASEIARRRHTDFFFPFSMLIPFSLVFRVLSSTLLPGFIGPESSVPPVNLPPSAPLRFGVSSSIRFAVVSTIAPALFYLRPSVDSSGNINDRTGGLPWVRRTTSPYAVRLHVGSVLRISGLALSRLLDLLPNTI